MNRRGQVGVRKQDEFAARREHALPHAVAFSAIPSIFEDFAALKLSEHRFGKLGGRVRAAVVNDEQFIFAFLLGKIGVNLL